jgi:hypothetical protein
MIHIDHSLSRSRSHAVTARRSPTTPHENPAVVTHGEATMACTFSRFPYAVLEAVLSRRPGTYNVRQRSISIGHSIRYAQLPRFPPSQRLDTISLGFGMHSDRVLWKCLERRKEVNARSWLPATFVRLHMLATGFLIGPQVGHLMLCDTQRVRPPRV